MNFNILSFKKDYDALRVEHEALLAQLTAKEEELALAHADIERLGDEVVKADEVNKQLQVALDEAKVAASRIAAETISNLGIEEGTIPVTQEAKEYSASELQEEYKRLKAQDPKKASEFFNKHRAEFLKYSGLKVN